MKANSVTLSGDLRKKLASCAVGKPETISITINPTAVSDSEIQGTVTGVAYDEPDAAPKKAPKPPKGPPPPPMKKGGRPKALVKAIGDY